MKIVETQPRRNLESASVSTQEKTAANEGYGGWGSRLLLQKVLDVFKLRDIGAGITLGLDLFELAVNVLLELERDPATLSTSMQEKKSPLRKHSAGLVTTYCHASTACWLVEAIVSFR